MKIFAKRTKKKAESPGPRTVNKSDPVVEELLTKDPSEWNAKERRMVKRYRDRKAQEPTEESGTIATIDVEKTKDADIENEAQKEDTKPEESAGDDSSSSSEDEDKNENTEDEGNDSDGDASSDNSESSNKMETQQTIEEHEEQTDVPDTGGAEEDDTKVPKDHEIWDVLDKLNSKQKRTLSRKLDRLGKSVLEEVEQEANAILDQSMPVEVDPKRDQLKATSTDKNSSSDTAEPKKKKRKKEPDWSSLSAEERLRREDQRRKQQEAAERRARGESIKPGHKRPLNSARRRANRRKPKWASKPSGAPDITDYKRDHHSSGFTHRKNRRAPEQTVNNY